jgi:hypothetical protein
MTTLTSDKHALIKAGFSNEDSVHQGLGQLTSRQEAHPGGFASLRKAVRNSADLRGAM